MPSSHGQFQVEQPNNNLDDKQLFALEIVCSKWQESVLKLLAKKDIKSSFLINFNI